MKFIFPTAWFAFLSAGFIAVTRSANGELSAVLFVMAVIGGGFLYRTCLPLKTVFATDDGIVVSNYFTTGAIPYHQISVVTENRWLNTRDAVIHLNSESVFGKEIRFQPYSDASVSNWRDHPAVDLLRQRIALKR